MISWLIDTCCAVLAVSTFGAFSRTTSLLAPFAVLIDRLIVNVRPEARRMPCCSTTASPK